MLATIGLLSLLGILWVFRNKQPRGAGVRRTLYLYSLGFLASAVLALLLLHGD